MWTMEKWSIHEMAGESRYTPLPNEIDPNSEEELRLYGHVYGRRPEFLNGEPIWTSAIQSVKDGVVTTKSGSKYVLGEMSISYKAWLDGSPEDASYAGYLLNQEEKETST